MAQIRHHILEAALLNEGNYPKCEHEHDHKG